MAFNDEVQTRKGLRWIPRHSETTKGMVNDKMLQGAENRHGSLQIVCCTIQDEKISALELV